MLNRLMHLPVLLFPFLLIMPFSLSGCGKSKEQKNLKDKPVEGKGKLTPCDFENEYTRRLCQHLGWRTGCVKYEFDPPVIATVEKWMEVWQDGKMVKRLDLGKGTDFQHPFGKGEFSFSARYKMDEKGRKNIEMRFAQASQKLRSTHTFFLPDPFPNPHIDFDKGSLEEGSLNLPCPVDFVADRGVAVWGIRWRHVGGFYTGGLPIEEYAKKAKVAWVFKFAIHPIKEKKRGATAP